VKRNSMASRLTFPIVAMWLTGIGLPSLAVGTVLATAPPAAAATGTPDCRASALNLFGSEPVVANPGETPCATDKKSLLALPLGALGGVGVLNAATDSSGTADASTAAVRLLPTSLDIRATVLTAHAECTRTLTGDSHVATLSISGHAIDVHTPPNTAVLTTPLATVILHREFIVDGVLFERALEVDSLLGTIIVSEARASHAPCGPVCPPDGDADDGLAPDPVTGCMDCPVVTQDGKVFFDDDDFPPGSPECPLIPS